MAYAVVISPLQAGLLQLSLSQTAQVPDHPAVTNPELYGTCRCQSSQIKSHHSPILQSLHWLIQPSTLNTNSFHNKVFTTTQPSYLHNRSFTVQSPRSTRSSSLVTIARPSASSITDRSFQYASPRLWNQLPASPRQPRTNLCNSVSPSPTSGTSPTGSIDSPLS